MTGTIFTPRQSIWKWQVLVLLYWPLYQASLITSLLCRQKAQQKKRATNHALVNTLMVIIFGIALVLRLQQNISFMLITGFELVGVILLSIAGWLGGTLVYRNQIGVDIRYAYAGKWKEEYIDSNEQEIHVASASELKVNQMILVHLNGKRIVIARTEKGYTAFDDHCTHRGGSLAAGAMICGTVQCPWHGSQFDALTGNVIAGPAKENIKTYSVKEVGGKVMLINPETSNVRRET